MRFQLGPAPGWWPDFLPWLFNPWPIFNFADSCISIGFILLLTGLGRVEWPNQDKAKEEGASKSSQKEQADA